MELKFVVYLSRHGVRSPSGKAAQYNLYSAAPWPAVGCASGLSDCARLRADEALWRIRPYAIGEPGPAVGRRFKDAARVTFYSDSNQRTLETGKALAAGFFSGMPACGARPSPRSRGSALPSPAHRRRPGGFLPEAAAIAGRIAAIPPTSPRPITPSSPRWIRFSQPAALQHPHSNGPGPRSSTFRPRCPAERTSLAVEGAAEHGRHAD